MPKSGGRAPAGAKAGAGAGTPCWQPGKQQRASGAAGRACRPRAPRDSVGPAACLPFCSACPASRKHRETVPRVLTLLPLAPDHHLAVLPRAGQRGHGQSKVGGPRHVAHPVYRSEDTEGGRGGGLKRGAQMGGGQGGVQHRPAELRVAVPSTRLTPPRPQPAAACAHLRAPPAWRRPAAIAATARCRSTPGARERHMNKPGGWGDEKEGKGRARGQQRALLMPTQCQQQGPAGAHVCTCLQTRESIPNMPH